MAKIERHAVNARLAKAIYERLRAEAEAEHRSLGNQVERILAERYAEEDIIAEVSKRQPKSVTELRMQK